MRRFFGTFKAIGDGVSSASRKGIDLSFQRFDLFLIAMMRWSWPVVKSLRFVIDS